MAEWGEKHPRWEGDAASAQAGRQRALRRFPLGPCERCGQGGFDRHHIDGNTLNNAAENISILCRRCHLTVDGRLAAGAKLLSALPKVGTAHPNARFSEEGIRQIRRRHDAGEFNTVIAKDYGVSHSTIARIVNRESYADVA